MSDGISDAFKFVTEKSVVNKPHNPDLCLAQGCEKCREEIISKLSNNAEKNYKRLVETYDSPAENHVITGKLELTEGTKYDAGKPMLDLVPASLEEAVGDILTIGAIKYERNNWKKGINYSRIVSSLKRHLNEFYKGNLIDKESGKPHLWHAACNIAFLIEFESKPEKYNKFNDIHENERNFDSR